MFDGSADELGVRVGGEQRLEDSLVEEIRPQDVGAAALPAMAIPREAGVVAVSGVAAVSRRPDVSPATRRTDDQAAEEELSCVAPPGRRVFATLSQKALRLGEYIGFDQRGMWRVVLHVAEGDLAHVGRVAQDVEHADV